MTYNVFGGTLNLAQPSNPGFPVKWSATMPNSNSEVRFIDAHRPKL